MDISYFGHSLFRLRGKSATLLTDPFDPEMVGLKYPRLEADIVTVSHQHEDHNFLERVYGYKIVISAPGEYEVSGVTIIGISSYHDENRGEKRGKNNIYIIEMDDLRLAHLGDIGHTLSEKLVEQIGDIDILFLPVGGFYTINPRQAASEIVQSIEPSVIIPMHYKLPGMKDDIFGKILPVEEFLKEVGLNVEKTEKYVVKKEDLGEEQKLVLLSTKA